MGNQDTTGNAATVTNGVYTTSSVTALNDVSSVGSGAIITLAERTILSGIETSADVTDAANVEAAGALMDSEVTNLAQVKAFDSTDYATAAQGTTADAALPKAGGAMTGAITTTSTFDGRDIAADGAVLDAVVASGYREVADETTSTTNQTTFTLTQTPGTNSKVKMYINGVRISNTAYTWSGNSLTYTPSNNAGFSLTSTDRIQFDYSY